ncbi:MAG: hypothetical protein IAG13_31300, partial [Deltaproteobacteria bacterium]|nr:hypothetical protein [Nannocystaceae bacterium]
AREPLREGDALLGAVDRMLAELPDDGFMHALPSLRQAFGYFPPRERFAIAERVVARDEGTDVAARSLVATLDATSIAAGFARDRAASAAFDHFGLEDT